MIKRTFDIVASLILILAFLPIFVLISLLIIVFMPGSVFFIHERVGKNGKSFKLIKFRTMQPPKKKEQGSFDAGDKSRITKLGVFLRKTKLDELPQLINVLKGEMSIVGPRPEVRKWTEEYPEQWRIALSVRPGITDNASIKFRNEEEILAKSDNPQETYRNEILPEKLKLYIDYVNNQSLAGDLKIILRTIKAVIIK